MTKSTARRLDDPPPPAPSKAGTDLAVEFGSLNISDKRISLTFSAPRANNGSKSGCTSKVAEQNFLNSRPNTRIRVDANAGDDVPGQETFEQMDGDTFETVCDVKQYSGKPKAFSSSLVFPVDLSDEERGKLSHFAGKRGRMVLTRVGDAGGDEEEGDEGSDE